MECIGFASTFFLESSGVFVGSGCWGLSGVLILSFDYSFLKSLKAEGSCLWLFITLINLAKLLCLLHKRCLTIHRNLKNCFHSLSFRNERISALILLWKVKRSRSPQATDWEVGTLIAREKSVTVSNKIVAVLPFVPYVDMFSGLC